MDGFGVARFGQCFEKPRGRFLISALVVCGLLLANFSVESSVAGESTSDAVYADTHSRMHELEKEIERRDSLFAVCGNLDAERARDISELSEKWGRVFSGVKNPPPSVVAESRSQIDNAEEYWKS